MMRLLPVVFMTLLFHCAQAQDYSIFTSTLTQLTHPSSHQSFESLWQELADNEQIPFVVEDSVAFLYRGAAHAVAWLGDFNDWAFSKNCVGVRVEGTDLWVLRAHFPKDARFDYKIVLNEATRILDPMNPKQQWSGLGGGSPNSELCMPEWIVDPITIYNPASPKGIVKRDILLDSRVLGYQITYSVYLPRGLSPDDTIPVVYVTDGYEYMHERMGNMIAILDNLLSLKQIQPIAAVFVDQREPANRANNRKMQELMMNQTYLDFYLSELMPAVERRYPVSRRGAERAILGNTMGGLTAAYFAFASPGTFAMAGIQSPSFWLKSDIYNVCDNPEHPPIKVFMTSGIFSDTSTGTRKMKDILDKNTCTYAYKEIDQGASWGNWRDTIDDILIYFFPPK